MLSRWICKMTQYPEARMSIPQTKELMDHGAREVINSPRGFTIFLCFGWFMSIPWSLSRLSSLGDVLAFLGLNPNWGKPNFWASRWAARHIPGTPFQKGEFWGRGKMPFQLVAGHLVLELRKQGGMVDGWHGDRSVGYPLVNWQRWKIHHV